MYPFLSSAEMYLYYLEPKGYLNDSDYLNNQIISDILAAVGKILA